jgi:hypothetical protein
MQKSDKSIPQNEVNQIAELKEKILQLEDHLYAVGFNATLTTIILKDVINGNKPSQEHLSLLNDTDFELKIIEDDSDM